MSSGSGVIAGPEVDMAELDVVSSAPLAVDLNLNLGPAFALELALGGQDFEESVPVSRPNWPRFEPSILAGGQEDEAPPIMEEPNLNLATPAIPDDHQDSVSAHVRARNLTGFDAGSSRGTQHGSLGHGGHENRDDAEGLPGGLLQAFRNVRHSRHPRRPRQVLFPPIQDLAQTQDSSEHGSTTESRAAGAGDSALSVILPRATRDERPLNTNLEIAPLCESSQERDNKVEAAAPMGANFECNICLEMATDPVVTCCGHLFCWPCLHQWLHLHSTLKECPVCKGILLDDGITPIYGRGTSPGTEKANGSTPARPHAHRISRKRQWQDRLVHDRPILVAATMGADLPAADRREPEASNTAEVVLSRLRVAQRLQRESIDERIRLRLHQRLTGMRGAGTFRSPAALGGATASQASLSPIRSSDQQRSEHVLTRMAINRLETADSLAAIGASMDGLRENLEHMQRTLESVGTLPAQIVGAGEVANTGTSAVAERLLDEGGVPLPLEAESQSLGHSTNAAELQVENSDLPQSSRRGWQRAASSSSGSFDVEPDSLHVRKRRRLN